MISKDIAQAGHHDVIILSASDDAITGLYQKITPELSPEAVVLHLSGSLRLAPGLDHVGSMHPPFAFSSAHTKVGDMRRELMFGLEGGRRATRTAAALCRGMELPYFSYDAKVKAGYHAAFSLLSAGTVALYHAAEQILNAAGIPKEISRRALTNLLRSTTANLEARPPRHALTGALKRGDTATITRHRRFLHQRLPVLLPLYDNITQVLQNLLAYIP